MNEHIEALDALPSLLKSAGDLMANAYSHASKVSGGRIKNERVARRKKLKAEFRALTDTIHHHTAALAAAMTGDADSYDPNEGLSADVLTAALNAARKGEK